MAEPCSPHGAPGTSHWRPRGRWKNDYRDDPSNLGTLGHPEEVRDEVIKYSAICGTALPILRGGFNFCRGMYQKNLDHVRAGVIQMIFG